MEKKDTLSSCSESEEQQMQLIQDKSKESCMVSFQRLHSHLKRLSNNDLKGSRTENGFGRAFATLFGQDFETFTGTMFLNMDQLQKQLDNNEFQEIGSMASFKVLETQFQMFIKSKIYLNDEYIVMTRNYFLQYTQLDIPEFRETLVQFMEYVKKSIDERALHKREHDSRVNERQTQTTMEKDTSSRSGNDADIRPIYDEEPMAEVQMTADDNVSATGQQHTEQPESNNEGEVDQNADQCYDTRPLPAKLTDNRTTELSNQLLESENIQKKGFAIAALKNELRKLTGNSVNTKFAKPSILGKPVLQPHRNQFVVRQPTAFKSERPKISKERFASQVDVSNDLLKPVTTHYLPKRRESAPAKPHYMIATSSSRYIVQSYKGRTQSLVAEKTDISENRASRNFDLMINIMTFEHSSSSLGHQCLMTFEHSSSSLGHQCLMTFEHSSSSLGHQCLMMFEHSSSSLGYQCLMMSDQRSSSLALHQMTSDHNRSELGIQDHSNE
ncbi:hypothetical protein Tco_0991196 [Tanacetum coccineum]|uniref:Uncharacterized protein n=1 Tax=Tanacetum coccineum TaxID=301880 RepID=A0ABQ5F0A1_9ASTR